MLRKVTVQSLIDLADAIRTKGTTALPLEWPDGYIDAVDAFETGDSENWELELEKYLSGAVCRIPDITTKLKDYAFYYYAALTDSAIAAMPAALQEIGKYAFCYCSLLTNIDLSGKSLETIKDYAFSNCTNVTNIDLSDNDLQTLGEYMLKDMTSLLTIDLSGNEHLTEIPANFARNASGYGSITSVDITDCPIESIGSYAFYDHVYLRYPFAFPNLTTLKSIGSYAFAGLYSVAGTSQPLDLSGCTSLETIGASAFEGANANGAKRYTGLTLPASIVSVGDKAFYYNSLTAFDFSRCTSLETIGAQCFIPRNSVTASVLDLSGCTSLRSLGANLCYASNAVLRIGQLILPSHTLQSIGENAFRTAQLANTETLTVKAVSIGGGAFNGCTGIKYAHIYDCTAFGINAFYGCTGLQEAHIYTKPTSFPSTIATYPIFNGCTALTDIYVPWSEGEVPENYFVKSTQHPTWHYNTL